MQEDEELWQQFYKRSLAASAWTHRAHLRIAWMHLERYSIDEAHLRMRVAIILLNVVYGVEETPTRGYHETLTRLWLHLVDAARVAKNAEHSEAFLALHPSLLSKSLPLEHYSQERINSLQARTRWVAPDRNPLPVSTMPFEKYLGP